MLALIIFVLFCLILTSNFLADEKLDAYFFDLDIIYFDFLEEEKIKQTEKKKQEEKIKFLLETIKTKELIRKINIKKMIKIEQKIIKNNNVIKLYKNNKKPVYITGCGYIKAYLYKPSSFDVWKAEGLNIKYKKEWQEKYKMNLRLSVEIKNYKNL